VSDKKKNIKKLAIGSGLAATAGYLVGLLTAPKSGKDTLDDIMGGADKGKTELNNELKDLSEELNKIIKQTKRSSLKMNSKTQKEVKGVIEKSMDTKEKLKEIASALHDGSADDEDLKRAIKNANNAVEHLKDYLKK
jgi:gas vesicle protein